MGLPSFAALPFGTAHWCAEFPRRISNSRRWSSPLKSFKICMQLTIYSGTYICGYVHTNLYVHRIVHAWKLQACYRQLQAAFQQSRNHWRNSEWTTIAQTVFSPGHSVVVWLTATQASREGYGPERLWRPKVFLFSWLTQILNWDFKAGFVVWSSASLGLGRSNKHLSEDLRVKLDTSFQGKMFFSLIFSLLPQVLSCTEMKVDNCNNKQFHIWCITVTTTSSLFL